MVPLEMDYHYDLINKKVMVLEDSTNKIIDNEKKHFKYLLYLICHLKFHAI